MAGGPEDAITTERRRSSVGCRARRCAGRWPSGQLSAWRTPGQHLRFTRQACIDFLRATGAAELAGRVERRTLPAGRRRRRAGGRRRPRGVAPRA